MTALDLARIEGRATAAWAALVDAEQRTSEATKDALADAKPSTTGEPALRAHLDFGGQPGLTVLGLDRRAKRPPSIIWNSEPVAALDHAEENRRAIERRSYQPREARRDPVWQAHLSEAVYRVVDYTQDGRDFATLVRDIGSVGLEPGPGVLVASFGRKAIEQRSDSLAPADVSPVAKALDRIATEVELRHRCDIGGRCLDERHRKMRTALFHPKEH